MLQELPGATPQVLERAGVAQHFQSGASCHPLSQEIHTSQGRFGSERLLEEKVLDFDVDECNLRRMGL